MTDRSSIVEGGRRPTQGADFAMLPALARRLGVSFDDTRPPRHLSLHGAGGVRLHALDWGGEGPPALFLHGGRLTAQTWDYACLGLARFANGEWIAIPDAGHNVQEDNPAGLIAAFSRFWSQSLASHPDAAL
jgi:hypothetical protein